MLDFRAVRLDLWGCHIWAFHESSYNVTHTQLSIICDIFQGPLARFKSRGPGKTRGVEVKMCCVFGNLSGRKGEVLFIRIGI